MPNYTINCFCCEVLSNPDFVVTTCGHSFHRDCINRWYKGRDIPSCPVCRTETTGTTGLIKIFYETSNLEDERTEGLKAANKIKSELKAAKIFQRSLNTEPQTIACHVHGLYDEVECSPRYFRDKKHVKIEFVGRTLKGKIKEIPDTNHRIEFQNDFWNLQIIFMNLGVYKSPEITTNFEFKGHMSRLCNRDLILYLPFVPKNSIISYNCDPTFPCYITSLFDKYSLDSLYWGVVFDNRFCSRNRSEEKFHYNVYETNKIKI